MSDGRYHLYKSERGHFYYWVALQESLFNLFPEALSVNGTTFDKKKEFHVTLLHMEPQQRNMLEPFFQTFVATHDLSQVSFLNEFRHAKDGDEESIAMRCRVAGLDLLFEKISTDLHIQVPLQPTHVTLYVYQGGGVSINSEEQMEMYPVISLPELQAGFESFPRT